MNIKKTKDAVISLAKEDKFKQGDFEPQNIGHRISIVVPEDVLMAYRKLGSEKALGYQTLMNQVLRDYVFSGKETNLTERIKRLEKAVFKKQVGNR